MKTDIQILLSVGLVGVLFIFGSPFFKASDTGNGQASLISGRTLNLGTVPVANRTSFFPDYYPPNTKDKSFLLGGNNEFFLFENNVFKSLNGKNWNEITSSASWATRSYHTALYFKNKIWVMGGIAKNAFTGNLEDVNDVYSSNDGISWSQVTANAPWSERLGHTSVVFKDKMFVIGGSHLTCGTTCLRTYYNDVWSSSDGINWTQLAANTPWSPRQGHTSFVFNNKIWITGGERELFPGSWPTSLEDSDVWSSPDGINWTFEGIAPWQARQWHKSIVFKGKMFVMGGAGSLGGYEVFNDVWSSTNGVSWIKEINNSPWADRMSHTAFIANNKMWIAGGAYYSPPNIAINFKDVWSSSDGRNWKKEANIPNLFGEGVASVVVK